MTAVTADYASMTDEEIQSLIAANADEMRALNARVKELGIELPKVDQDRLNLVKAFRKTTRADFQHQRSIDALVTANQRVKDKVVNKENCAAEYTGLLETWLAENKLDTIPADLQTELDEAKDVIAREYERPSK